MKKVIAKGYQELLSGKMILYVMALLIACFIMPITAYAQTATIKAVTGNVRSEANTTSDVVSSVKSGDKVTIEDEKTGADGKTWYYVTLSNGSKGYVRYDLVSVGEQSQGTGKVVYVAENTANIRNESSTSGALVATVSKGVELTVEGEETGADGKKWYSISFTYEGQTVEGYIRSDLATTEKPSQDAASSEITGSTTEESETPEEGAEGDTDVPTEEAEPEAEPDSGATTTPTVQGGYTILTATEDPMVPIGYDEVAVSWNEEEIRAWKNGDYFLFYSVNEAGTEGYVRYDSIEKTFQRYDESEAREPGFFANMTLNFVLIALVILLVAAIICAILFYYKYSDSLIESELENHAEYSEARKEKAKNTWKSLNFLLTEEEDEDDEEEYDEYEEEDEYEDDEDDDDYIEEEEYVAPAPKKQAKQQPKSQPKAQPRRQAKQAKPVATPAKKQNRVAPAGGKNQPAKAVQPVKTVQGTKPAQVVKQTNQKEPVGMETQMLSDMEFIDIDSL